MPRIEVLPPGWDESAEALRGDGSPCIDVCRKCARSFEDGDVIEDEESKLFNFVIGSTEVEHPDYNEDIYNCHECGRDLHDGDN